jgi:hypothetical protein
VIFARKRTQLQAAATQLRTTVQQATGVGFLVLPSGQVMPGPSHYSQAAAAGPGAPAVLQAYQAIAQAYTVMIQTMVTGASMMDATIAGQLRAGGLQPTGQAPANANLFSRSGALTNREVQQGGVGLPRTMHTVDQYARLAGVDFGGMPVEIVEEADDVAYLGLPRCGGAY